MISAYRSSMNGWANVEMTGCCLRACLRRTNLHSGSRTSLLRPARGGLCFILVRRGPVRHRVGERSWCYANLGLSSGEQNMHWTRILGVALIVAGVIMLFMGWNATESLTEQASEAISGRYTDETRRYLIGGAVAGVVGLLLVILGAKR